MIIRAFSAMLAGVVGAFGACAQTPLTVSAAASLTDPLTKIVDQYRIDYRQQITLNFGASGSLLAQIKQGATVDLFISAADEQVQDLIRSGLADAATRRIIAGNSLVLISGSQNTVTSSSSLTSPAVRKIAIGDPQFVPAGVYAMQTLKGLGIDQQIRSKLVYAQNVRQVVLYVQRHEVDAGIVYRSDAVAAGNSARVLTTAAESLHDPIEYPAVILRRSMHRTDAGAFLYYLASPAAQQVLASYGFSAPPKVANTTLSLEQSNGSSESLWRSLRLSLVIAGVATIIAALVGVLVAYAMSRRQFPGRGALEALICVPLVLPPTVVGYLLIVALGANSAIGRLLHYSILFRMEGAIVAAATVALPLIYIPARSAFSSIDRELEDIARLMGAGLVQTFWHLSLPLARRGIAGGLVLGFARGLGEFGATMMVFGMQPGRMTLPISIYADFESLNLRHAWPAVVLLIGVSIGVMLAYNHFVRRRGPGEA